jgi:hypothetical protein
MLCARGGCGPRRPPLLWFRLFLSPLAAALCHRFPGDVELVGRIVRYLAAQPGGGAPLPSGSLLTPRLLQTLGLSGM